MKLLSLFIVGIIFLSSHQSLAKNIYKRTITIDKTFLKNQDSPYSRPEILDKEISLTKGVYGVALGDSYQHLVDKFGEPSTQITMFTDELIVGYGRRHWFHFQNDKLVKVQSMPPVLAQYIVNEVPFLDFFDDFSWKINNEITYKTLLTDVRTAGPNSGKNMSEDTIIFENETSTLSLLFNNYRTELGEHPYTLEHFVLAKKYYKQSANLTVIERDKHFDFVTDFLASETRNYSSNSIKESLGEPVAKILLSKQKKIAIYNNNLMAYKEKGKIKSLALVDELFAPGVLPASGLWYFGNFKQGLSIDQLNNELPSDSFILDNVIKFETDEYFMSLLFDEHENQTALYQAKITIY